MRISAEKQCTAHSKQTGKRCKQPRVTGRTVCHYHGGRAGRPPKHGFRAKLTPEEEERFDELVATLDCSKAFAYVQAKLEAGALEKADLNDPEMVGMIVDLLRKQIASAKAIKETLEGATYNVRVVDGKALEAVIDILRKYVPRDKAADAIAELRAAAGA